MIIYALVVTSCFAVPHLSDGGSSFFGAMLGEPIFASPRERDWTDRTVTEKSCHLREESLHKTQAKCLAVAASRIKEITEKSSSAFSTPEASAVCEQREVQE